MNRKRTAAILFGGVGGYTAGIKKSLVEAYGGVHTFEVLCSIDFDPVACKNHDLITGEQSAVCMDLFDRNQYRKWFGCEPPAEWKEVTPWDMWVAFGYQVPDYIFLSPPCKGFSGLLPSKSAASEKYQALNLLTIRGLQLCLDACEMYGDGELPAFIHFENVPRITSRGKDILSRIKKLLKGKGFAYDIRTDHNLGEIGGLGANRLRFLLLARNEKRVPNFCYLPPKRKLRTIGDVIGPLPMPGDIAAGGPLHRLSRLQWKTWVRLALIPPGGDWRDLNKIDWENYRIMHEPRGGGAYGVQDWSEPGNTVTGQAKVNGSSGCAAVSDPRFDFKESTHTAIYRVSRHDEAGPTVTGAHRPNNGAICISDPRLLKQDGKHPGVYRIVRADEPSPTVTGTRFGSGAIAIADPRVNGRANRYTDQYRMQDFDKSAATVTGTTDVQSGAQLVADPRVKTDLMPDSYGVQDWDDTAKTIRGNSRIMQSASSIADPRMKCTPRADTMGVMDWEQPAKVVIGSADVHAGAAAVADHRIPDDRESGTWIIIAEDGTWHRPLTTYELAMLQGFDPHLPDGRPFQLEDCSDAKAREYIGNAVPPPAAEAMGNVILIALAAAEAGMTFEMSHEAVWVVPEEDRLPVMVH
jgi:site-specific DNA-cytosine methylase